jgi:uncharacterized protein
LISRRLLMQRMTAGAICSVGFSAWGTIESDQIEVVEKEIRLPSWDAQGSRIAVLADFHMVHEWDKDRALEAFRLAHAAKPDMLVLVGDFISRQDPVEIKYVKELAGEIHATANYPVFAVLGNHDYAQGPGVTHRLVTALRQNGVRLLANEHVDSNGIVVLGYDDALFGHFEPNQSLPPFGARSVLGLLHEPDYVRNVPPDVHLVVSGHSHGGQICLPGGIGLCLPAGGRIYTSGYYADSQVPVFVTRGIGTTGPTLRVFCRPEVSILTVKSA